MAGVRSKYLSFTSVAALAFATACGTAAYTHGQIPPSTPLTQFAPPVDLAANPQKIEPKIDEMVAEVRVEGNRTKSTTKVLKEIKTRAGRPFDREKLTTDVRMLASKSWFLDVKPEYARGPAGLIITFKVIERPILEYVKFVGNVKIKLKKLAEQTELKAGMSRDPYAVEEGKRKIEQLYHEKGYNHARCTIIEGNKPNDRGAIFLINEGHAQKIKSVRFEGNTIDTDSRLKTYIQSKPPIFWIFKGEVDRQKIDEDVDRLTAFYRSLGFFRARVGRELDWNEEQKWLTLTFVIDEGPRYHVRNIAVMGNTKFETQQLTADLKLKNSEFFNQPKMDADLGTIRDIYGSVGYCFADVQAETRFLEEPGQVDLVYNIAEGKRYRVGRINVKIEGEHPHTRQQAVLNRMGFRPGDIVDIRKIRDAERRLKASGLFMNDVAQQIAPKVQLVAPELDGEEAIADQGGGRNRVRGQSPDGRPIPVIRCEAPNEVLDYALEEVHEGEIRRPAPPPAAPSPRYNNERRFEPDPIYPRDPAPELPEENVIIRGQSPDSGYPREREVIRGQFAPLGGGRSIGGMPRPRTYPAATTPAAASNPYDAPPTSNPYSAAAPPATSNPYDAAQPPANPYAAAAPANPYAAAQPASNPYSAPASTPYTPPANNSYAPPSNGGYAQYEPVAPPPSYAAPPANPYSGGAYGPPGGGPAGFGQPGIPPAGGPVDPFGNGGFLDPNGGVNPSLEPPDGYVDVEGIVQETQTGRFMFGVGVNSDAGLVGSVVIDEQNFDWRRWPVNGWEDFRNGTAFRGAGQKFRIEAAPGTQVQRYLFNFSEPFLFDTPVSLGLSAFYFTRGYVDWQEERLGGGVNLGYQFTPDLSGTVGFTGQSVDVSNVRQPTPPALAEVIGNTSIYTFSAQLAHDTRDNTFMPTEGHRIGLKFEQTIGDFVFPRVTLEGRQYFPIRQRPDGSGRHVISLIGQVGVSGDDTPIYDRFFIGGFSTLRGFRFRGAGPYDLDVNVGGDFMMLASAEYMFPITADDMIRGVTFVDTGTVAQDVDLSDYRVAPGVGLRITVPALGPAPIALDFAFPVAFSDDDQRQVFSFFMGFSR